MNKNTTAERLWIKIQKCELFLFETEMDLEMSTFFFRKREACSFMSAPRKYSVHWDRNCLCWGRGREVHGQLFPKAMQYELRNFWFLFHKSSVINFQNSVIWELGGCVKICQRLRRHRAVTNEHVISKKERMKTKIVEWDEMRRILNTVNNTKSTTQ